MKGRTGGGGVGGGGRRQGRTRSGVGDRGGSWWRLEGWGKTQIKGVIYSRGNSKSGTGALKLGTETLTAIGDGRKNEMMEREGLAVTETKKSIGVLVTSKRTGRRGAAQQKNIV